MNTRAHKLGGILRTATMVSALSLLVAAGCTAGDPSQQLSGLLGGFARQVVAIWVL